MKFPDKSANEIFTELSLDKNRRSRKTYRPEDVGYAVSQIEGFRKEYPNISIENILKMIQEVHEYREKNEQKMTTY